MDRYLVESGFPDGFRLEDDSGVLLLENGQCYLNAVLADKPTSYWRLGEASGNPQDSVGTNHVTVIGGSPTYGVTGALGADSNTAVTFDGSTNYFTVPDATSLDFGDGPFSVEFWAKRADGAGTGYDGMWMKASQGNVNFTNGVLTVDNDANNLVHESGSTADTKWHHFVWTRLSSGTGNNKIYKDGIDVSSETGATLSAVTASNATRLAFAVDATTLNPANAFAGSLDEIAVYNKVLSAATILAHYNASVIACGNTYKPFSWYDLTDDLAES